MSYPLNLTYEDYNLKDFLYVVNMGKMSSYRNVQLLHMNIRSINANLLCFESVFLNMSRQPDFMVFTECWLSEDVETYRNFFFGYRMVFSSGSNKNGGVVLFCKNVSVKITDSSQNFLSNCDSLQISFDCYMYLMYLIVSTELQHKIRYHLLSHWLITLRWWIRKNFLR